MERPSKITMPDLKVLNIVGKAEKAENRRDLPVAMVAFAFYRLH